MTMDTPDGSVRALHWFFAAQPPDFPSGADGSGGVFQEITVTPGVPLEYSYWWKGASSGGEAWFELLLIDGSYSFWYCDAFQEGDEGQNNPYMVRKKLLSAAGVFEWEQITHETPADPGPFGDRPTTITPTGTTVTVVLKAGRLWSGGMEALFDNIEVRQAGGPNLLVNGDFEDPDTVWPCENEAVYQDPCERDFWRRSDFLILPECPTLPHDIDEDTDVDQDDFAAFQLCYTGDEFTGELTEACRCLDIDFDGDIGRTDWIAFEICASGPEVPADPTCVTQACCFETGECQDLKEVECANLGGTSQGRGTNCANTQCEQPVACCFGDGSCADLPEAVCTAQGGQSQGAGSDCATTVCEVPEGCCFDGGTCSVLLPSVCSNQGGVPRGPGSDCATACLEACCYSGGYCADYPVSTCLPYGTPMGAGTTCATVTCP
jgi:hypothetical protein